jgi:hypothetical protein
MRRHRLLYAVLLAVAGMAVMARAASAQAAGQTSGSGGAVALEAVGGYAGFLDESPDNHLAAGGAGRFRVSSRLWVGGEVLRTWGPDESHDWIIMPFVAFDLTSGRIVPYLVAGVGWLRETQMVGTGPYTSTSWTVGGGGGVRFAFGRRGYVVFEGRLGTEPLTRATVAIGWRLR